MNCQKIFLVEDVNQRGSKPKAESLAGSTFKNEIHSAKYHVFDDVRYNQNGSCFLCLKSTIDSKFSLQTFETDPLKLISETVLDNLDPSHVVIAAELYHKSNLVFLLVSNEFSTLTYVSSQQTKKENKEYTLQVWDDSTHTIVFEKPQVLGFYLSNKKNHLLIMSSDHSIKSYKIKVDRIKEMPMPPLVLLSSNIDFKRQMLVFPSPNKEGQVQIAKVPFENSLTPSNRQMEMGVFKAHKNAIAKLSLSNDASCVATCSERGTIIRVFQINLNKTTITTNFVCEFKRGLEVATIYELQWSTDDNRIACMSNKNTLHIFQTPDVCIQEHSNHESAYLSESEEQETPDRVASSKAKNKMHDKVGKTHTNICSSRPKIRVIGDRCKITWIDNTTLCLVWKKAGVWEKYTIEGQLNNYTLIKTDWKFLQ